MPQPNLLQVVKPCWQLLIGNDTGETAPWGCQKARGALTEVRQCWAFDTHHYVLFREGAQALLADARRHPQGYTASDIAGHRAMRDKIWSIRCLGREVRGENRSGGSPSTQAVLAKRAQCRCDLTDAELAAAPLAAR